MNSSESIVFSSIRSEILFCIYLVSVTRKSASLVDLGETGPCDSGGGGILRSHNFEILCSYTTAFCWISF